MELTFSVQLNHLLHGRSLAQLSVSTGFATYQHLQPRQVPKR